MILSPRRGRSAPHSPPSGIPARGARRRRASLVALAAFVASSLAACGSDSPSASNSPIATITISPDTLRLLAGAEGRLGVTLRDSAGNAVRGPAVFWSSADAAIATIDQDGLVHAQRPGSVQISANAAGRSDVSDVVVSSAGAASVTVDPPTASVLVGGSTQLGATVRDAQGAVLTDRPPLWSSGNSGVATVNQQGLVTGVSPGTATIVAARDGHSGSATVTVLPTPVAKVVVSPASTEVRVNHTVKLTARTYDAQGKELTGRTITWSSGNTARATVDQTGLVTGRLTGVVTITATSEGQTGSAQVTVKL